MTVTDTNTGFTLADLEAMPDDGRRYELIGGSIVVTPPPDIAHQRSGRRLQRLLEHAFGPSFEVFDAPVGLSLPTGDEVEPDLVVVEAGRDGARLAPPVELVVEVLSPGSARHDSLTKLDAYARAGIGHYWLLDSRPGHRRFRALRLASDTYETVADSTARVEMTDPVTVTTTLAELFDSGTRR